MSNSEKLRVSRRAVLGGAAALLGGGLASPPAAWADGPGPRRDGSTRRPVDRKSVDAVASRLDRDLVELRRDIHRHPETAGTERRTAAVVARRLRAAGLDVRTGVGGHGVVAVLTGARPGRTVAYRADMDAVPPGDQFGGGPLPAHLCGHDVHTTVGVGVAEVLAMLRNRLTGSVVFVFQPAEEALAGAAAMLDDDVFARVRPAEIHALHCGPFPVGQFVVTPGCGLPGQDRGTVTLTGPDATARAQRLAAEINVLGTVTPPATPADIERLVADILTPDGPLAEFVFIRAEVPDAEGPAEVRISYRCWPEHRYPEIREQVRRLAGSYGGAVGFPNDPFPAMLCPEQEGLALRRYLRQSVGHARVRTLQAPVPFNGEDFALFLDRLPGTYTFLGVQAPGAGVETSAPHFGTFDPDERAIGYGVRAMAGWLAGRTRT
ncbi:M20 metallopeptidase family protein [Plantactinospora sp. KLBMP9567]|uniref:M20 metallopeptidase family protein n=1 Tax=Plantactinospora sp. KLBMP9567 TaxID=3085900 RepID=UPI00298119B9|nr:M20/M25/M40 family metallo-hydrolase [Plantactinospora sp. KLBMP9567]MDW5326692.1 M20/M25/M40 family metallo-hydrolase [Plantactinospora sp. KLBMP9567]